MHLVEGVDKRRGAVRHVFVPRRAHHFIQALADGVLQPAVDEVLLRRTLEYNMSMLYKYDHFLHPNPCRWRQCVCVCPPLQTRFFAVAVAPDLTLLVSLLSTEQGAPSSAHRDADAGALERALIQVKTE